MKKIALNISWNQDLLFRIWIESMPIFYISCLFGEKGKDEIEEKFN